MLLFSISFISCLGTIEGCGNSTIRITHDYQIRVFENIPGIDARNVFFCKLGDKSDPIINHVEYIEWDDKLIKLRTKAQKYYIILSEKDYLCCGCNDTIIGPINEYIYNTTLIQMNATQTLKNVKNLSF